MDVVAIIGTVAGVAAAVIGYLQLRTELANRRAQRAADDSLAAKLGDLSLFAPNARYRGFDVGLVDRRAESADLVRQVRSGRSVIAIAGIAGVGKTALAAHLCGQLHRRREIRWIFCDEKGSAVTLTGLAKALASGRDSASVTALRAAVRRRATASDLIDAIIDVLAAQRLLLVLDNFHVVTDPHIEEFLARLEHSRTASCVLLTSRVWVRDLHPGPLVGQVLLHGLAAGDSRVLLRHREVLLSEQTADFVWHRAGDGNPLALTLFAGRARDADPEELAMRLPESIEDFDGWIGLAFDGLADENKVIAKIIAFAYDPIPRDILYAIAAPLDPTAVLADLTARFLIRENLGRFEMHSEVRDYISRQTTDPEQADLAAKFTEYYRGQARAVFLDGLGTDEPSYGLVYLESFPDYAGDTERHIRFVDDLLDRLADNGYRLDRGARILVLGAGDGTHDPGFAKHGLDVTNVDIQPEIVDRGRARAAALPAEIDYLVADMTRPLPRGVASRSMDAVFNIGSSFGYEDSDDTNAMVFRNAATALRRGAPFVFEYVNGPHWENKRVQRQVEVTPLPGGATRTRVSITNPDARTSLSLIGLQRADGTGGWFRHFMHYYRLAEILKMMEDAGLRPVATYGAVGGRVTGEPFDERDSEAMVVIAQRA